MIEQIANAITLAHPVFKYGFPHERSHAIPLPNESHFVLFDTQKKSPLFVLGRLLPSTEAKDVDRDDDFIPDARLPEELQTKSAHYQQWNEDNPDNPMDRGHLMGSQMRRSDRLLQHAVDVLSGVIPETPALNRRVKNPLECAIVAKAREAMVTYYAAGPAWESDVANKLPGGQWIPDYSWVSVIFEGHTKQECWTFLMNNAAEVNNVRLRPISLAYLEELTGRMFWGAMPGLDRTKINRRDTWWTEGQ